MKISIFNLILSLLVNISILNIFSSEKFQLQEYQTKVFEQIRETIPDFPKELANLIAQYVDENQFIREKFMENFEKLNITPGFQTSIIELLESFITGNIGWGSRICNRLEIPLKDCKETLQKMSHKQYMGLRGAFDGYLEVKYWLITKVNDLKELLTKPDLPEEAKLGLPNIIDGITTIIKILDDNLQNVKQFYINNMALDKIVNELTFTVDILKSSALGPFIEIFEKIYDLKPTLVNKTSIKDPLRLIIKIRDMLRNMKKTDYWSSSEIL